MAGFLYYMQGMNSKFKAGLKQTKVLPHLKGIGGFVPCHNGPDGSNGLIFTSIRPNSSPDETETKIGYYKHNQKWFDLGEYWLGYEKENAPTPKDLAKEMQIDGLPVRLNGNDWLVPIARRFTAGSVLPKRLCLGAKGETIEESLPEFLEFSKIADEIFNDYALELGIGEGVPILTSNEAIIERASKALGVNYQISEKEVLALGILNHKTMHEVMEVVIDFSFYIKAVQLQVAATAAASNDEKKNSIAPKDGSSSENGNQGN